MNCFQTFEKVNPEPNKLTLLHLTVVEAAIITNHYEAADSVVHQKFNSFNSFSISRNDFILFLYRCGLILVSLNDIRSAMWKFYACYTLSPHIAPLESPPLYSFTAYLLYTLSAIALEGFVHYPLPNNFLTEEVGTLMRREYTQSFSRTEMSPECSFIKEISGLSHVLTETAKNMDIANFFSQCNSHDKIIKQCGCENLCEKAKEGIIRRAVKDIALLYSKISLSDLIKKMHLFGSFGTEIHRIVTLMFKDGSLIGSCDDINGECIITMKVARQSFDSETSADNLQDLLESLISDKNKL